PADQVGGEYGALQPGGVGVEVAGGDVLETDALFEIRYANAGRPMPIALSNSGDVTELDPTGPMLGAFDASWHTRRHDLPVGGLLTIYTDGIIEARDTN